MEAGFVPKNLLDDDDDDDPSLRRRPRKAEEDDSGTYFFGAPGTAFAPSASSSAPSWTLPSAPPSSAHQAPSHLDLAMGALPPQSALPQPALFDPEQLSAMLQLLAAAGISLPMMEGLAGATGATGATATAPEPPPAPAAPAPAPKGKWASIAAKKPAAPVKGAISAEEEEEKIRKEAEKKEAAKRELEKRYPALAAMAASMAAPAPVVIRDTRPLCSFFLQGRCLKGDTCRFRHAAAASEDLVDFFCFKMQEAAARQEREVAAKHAGSSSSMMMMMMMMTPPAAGGAGSNNTGASSTSEAELESEGIKWEQQQQATGGGPLALLQNDLVKAAVEAGFIPSPPPQSQSIEQQLSEVEAALQLAERRVSASLTCGICLDSVLLGAAATVAVAATVDGIGAGVGNGDDDSAAGSNSNSTSTSGSSSAVSMAAAAPSDHELLSLSNRRFGLLTNCSHCFCLPCIKQWRGRIDLPKETVRGCPVCRTTSFFIIPCDRFVADPVRKAEVRRQFNSQQKTIPCRYFDLGKGECPFGSSCHYAHLNPDGTPYQHARHTLRLDAEGTAVNAGRKYKLSEFI